jgi:hypothetical protein
MTETVLGDYGAAPADDTFDEWDIVAGVPARVVKHIDRDQCESAASSIPATPSLAVRQTP